MDLVIRNVKLIDGTGASAISEVSVEVTGSAISWIGSESSRPKRTVHQEDINGQGLTLIPGMIDCHEHFTGDGGTDVMDRLLNDTAEEFTLKAVGNCRRSLMSGVTTARDVGARFGVNINIAKQTAAGAVFGPRIIASGEWFQYPGTWPAGLTRTTETPEELLLGIQDMIQRGAGLIKVGATGFRPDGAQFPSMSREALDAAVRAAHDAGLKIAAHCHGFEGTLLAVEAGIDSIEHGTYVDEPTVRLMAEKGTYMVPTMSTWDARERLAIQAGLSKDQMADVYDRKENSIASFKRALQAGVIIATGTDAGGSPARHGFVAREIELMVDNGMTPQAALEASTRVASELLGVQEQVGTIEVGKQADMVLIDGDPHSDIGALKNIWAVFQGGRRVR
ncbi:MAG TPA: amidohydrolase family protein [Dehalococcoidia bacterium]|nr:amidohydrolase family protein [Dehalococcoidia bacterium]